MEGQKIEEKSSNINSKNVDVVTSILEEVKSPEVKEDERVDTLVRELFGDINVVVEKKADEVEKEEGISRREFLKRAGTLVGAAFLGSFLPGCAPKGEEKVEVSEEKIESNPTVMPNEVPLEGVEAEYESRGYTLLEKYEEIDTEQFVMAVPGYQTAIADGFPFPYQNKILKYGDTVFSEVTYMHNSKSKPPVVGDVVGNKLYELPEKKEKIFISPYAMSMQSNPSEELTVNDGFKRYLLPIIVSGTSTGITPTSKDGQLVNSIHEGFKITPPLTGSTEGYLSFAVLKIDGSNIVMEGVVNNNETKLYLDYKNIPEEISELYKK